MNNKIVNIIVIFVALMMSLMLGQWVVTDPEMAGMVIAIGGTIAVFALLRQHVWVLIPSAGALSISFPWIPGYFSPQELALMFVIGSYALLFLVNRHMVRLRVTSIEVMAIIIFLFIFQAFLRNPAGVRMMGGEYVGGRPYLIVIISFIGGLLLASTTADLKRIKLAYKLSLFCYLGSLGIQATAQLSAKAAGYVGMLFGSVNGGHISSGSGEDGRAGRNMAAGTLAEFAGRFLIANRNPLRAFFHPFWLSVIGAAIVGAGMSGFRNVIVSTGLTLLFGAYYWGRSKSVVIALMLAVLGYIGANIVNLTVPLPPKIQRTLSILPGTWDEQYVVDAQGSTDWRVEMWESALTTDNYIENKIIGDGLGIRRHDWELMMAMQFSPMITDEMSQERAMLAGDFHSGPVTTIRVIGYIGLLFFIIAQMVLAVRAHKLIKRSRDSAYFSCVLFFCIQMVWSPLFFIFVMGSFKAAAPLLFLQMGLLRLLETSFANSQLEMESSDIEPSVEKAESFS